MKICIITPVFNGESLILDTIDSIINQKNIEKFYIEYIVCDGGSTDKTLELIASRRPIFLEKGIKLSLISEYDNGMYDALVKGMRLAGLNFDYYCYINVGDFFSNYAFDSIFNVMHLKKIHWITGLQSIYSPSGKLVYTSCPLDYNRRLIQEGFYGKFLPFIQQESTFWSRWLQSKIDLDEFAKYKYAGDYFLWKSFSNFSDLYVLKCWVSGFRLHENQLSSIYKKEYMKEFNLIRSNRNLASWFIFFSIYFISLLNVKSIIFLKKRIIDVE